MDKLSIGTLEINASSCKTTNFNMSDSLQNWKDWEIIY